MPTKKTDGALTIYIYMGGGGFGRSLFVAGGAFGRSLFAAGGAFGKCKFEATAR